MVFEGYRLGLILILSFFVAGFVFSFHYWRYDPITVVTEIRLAVPSAVALRLATEAMERADIRHIDASFTAASVCGRTRASLRSIGTRCRVEIVNDEEGCRLKCSCWPRAQLVLTDWGASRDTSRALVGRITSLSTSSRT